MKSASCETFFKGHEAAANKTMHYDREVAKAFGYPGAPFPNAQILNRMFGDEGCKDYHSFRTLVRRVVSDWLDYKQKYYGDNEGRARAGEVPGGWG